jgi:hypothetical protein
MEFPDEFLRGISIEQCFEDEGTISSSIFSFSNARSAESRGDGFIEESINWKDDEQALQILLDQRKEDGSIQFKKGVAVLCKHSLETLTKNQTIYPNLAYERREIPGNLYHGNILLSHNLSPSKRRRIIAAMVTICYKEYLPNSGS